MADIDAFPVLGEVNRHLADLGKLDGLRVQRTMLRIELAALDPLV